MAENIEIRAEKNPSKIPQKRSRRNSDILSLLKMNKLDEEMNIPNFDRYSVIPHQTIMNIYGGDFENLTSLIHTEEVKTKEFFNKIRSDLDEKYDKFNLNINSHIVTLTTKITDAFKLENSENTITNEKEKSNLIQKYSKDYIKRIENIIETHKQIMQSIKETINIFLNFLDITNLLQKEKPINDFFEKEFKNIINSWMFLKLNLNLEKFDFAQALGDSGLDSNFKNFLVGISQGKNMEMNINVSKEFFGEDNIRNISIKDRERMISEKNKNKTLLKENCNNLVKLTMTNINDIESYIENINSFNNMKTLMLKNIIFKNKNYDFLKCFNKLNKLNIINSKNFDIKILENLSKNITSLTLSNNNLVDFEFNIIMNNYLKQSPNIRNNLEYLSFSKNNLSFINLTGIISQKTSFFALKSLDFSNNSIYKLSIPFEYFTELKTINLSNNNLSSDDFGSLKDIIVLQSGNIFLSNRNLSKKYYEELSNKLNQFNNIKLTCLNLSYIPNIISSEYFSNLKINDTILLGLKKLDFSYNNITNKIFFDFIENNKGLLNIKSINLRGNKLNDMFMEIYLNQNLNNKFTKLKKINLEENLLGDDDITITPITEEGDSDNNSNNRIYKLRLLYKFIAENKSLNQMNITKNDILKSFQIFDVYQNSENNFKVNRKGKLIINCLNSLLLKVKRELLIKNDESCSEFNRNKFNLKFDCQTSINQNSESYTNGNEWL